LQDFFARCAISANTVTVCLKKRPPMTNSADKHFYQ